jgi:hypothetical protein
MFPNLGGKGSRRGRKPRVPKPEAKRRITEILGKGPARFTDLLKGTESGKRTLVDALKELENDGVVRKLARGLYALVTYLPFDEAAKYVNEAMEALKERGDWITTVEAVSSATGIPDTWRVRVGEVEFTFKDLVFALAGKHGIKIVPREEAPRASLEAPLVGKLRRAYEARFAKPERRNSSKEGEKCT